MSNSPQAFFTPIDVNTSQEDAVCTLASLLYAEGVEDMVALPLATAIFKGVQAALRDNNLSAAIREWNPDTRPRLSGERRGHCPHCECACVSCEECGS